MNHIYVAIMAGGIGSRFWPASRIHKPKQFLDILNTGKTLIQSTYERFLKIAPKDNIFIVTNEAYLDLVHEQLPEMNPSRILAEPMRRNTAPCIAYVSHKILTLDPQANIIVAPSDHLIRNEQKFLEVMYQGLDYTSTHDDLLTLGIKPTRPDTGYGYIQFDDHTVMPGIHKVKTFTEKPDKELAKAFISSGDFLWNSGIFIWNVRCILNAFERHLQDINHAFAEAQKYFGKPEEAAAVEKAYSLCTNISIDFGIMEKASNVYVIPSGFGWSDLGTWTSLWSNYNHDYHGHAVKGNRVLMYDSKDCMVIAPDNKLVVLQGMDDYVVVDSGDVLLVCKKDQEQQLKEITTDIKRYLGDTYL